MEHAQREVKNIVEGQDHPSLNPYFNGTCSKSFKSLVFDKEGELTS